MGYRFLGDGGTDYGSNDFYFDSHGSPKSLKSGDWIDAEDIEYMRVNHPNWIQEIPGEGPGSSEIEDGGEEGTTVDFRVFSQSGRPPIPPVGTFRMFMRTDGKLYVLNSEGRDMPLRFDALTQTWGDY